MNYGTPSVMEYYLMVRVSLQTDAPVSVTRQTDTDETLKIEVQGQVLYNDELLAANGIAPPYSFKLPFHSNGE